MQPQILHLPDGRRLAHHRLPGRGPGIVFLGGFRSDMTGTKARFLEARARAQGRAFLRFDYTGHGASSGDFLDGGIGDWVRDAEDAVARLTGGPQVLVGSSMGGWIALRLAQRVPERVAAFLGIAAAPDFTEDAMWQGFSAEERARLMAEGRLATPSDYSEAPYVITRRLIEDGRENLVLRAPLRLPFPVRLLHGIADADVALAVPLRLVAHAECPDLQLTLVKDADHRFSTPQALELTGRTLDALLERLEQRETAGA